MREKTKNVIYTVTANCQDCYRCVRVCPVKAISVIDGQAYVEDELCIKCGTCVRECPQGAKTIRSALDHVKNLIESDQKVAVSLAPSFAAAFPLKDSKKMPSALRKLGFDNVSETAEGAFYVTEKSFQNNQNGICSACPTVVSYIEKYRPEHIENIIPVVSPMVAHGRLIKERLGKDWAVVFIGPCAAKKEEAEREEYKDSIDGVLTFVELMEWMEEEAIALEDLEESSFDNEGLLEKARLFPIQGGMLKTGNIEWDGTRPDVIHISGADDVIGILDLPPDDWSFSIVEPLFCSGGCINGPGFPKGKNLFTRKQDVIAYAEREFASDEKADQLADRGTNKAGKKAEVNYKAAFSPKSAKKKDLEVSEEVIRDILENTGKSDPAMQLNCGACGYKSCRENAIAVAKGMAETEMCVSYMRRMAQQRGDRIISTTPNGVVVVDRDLNIISMNPAFQNMFMCSEAIIGRHISYLLDGENYEKLAKGELEQAESVNTKYGIKYHEKVYALREENNYVGIYSDLTSFKFDESQIDLIKNQTLEQAKELLYHQIEFSQQMAHFLGKSTAQSEEMVKRIMDLYDENDFKQKD